MRLGFARIGITVPDQGRFLAAMAIALLAAATTLVAGATEIADGRLQKTPAANADDAASAAGAALYGVHCARCHGPSGRGDGPDADLFVTRPRNLRGGFLRRYSTRELVDRVRTGAPLNLAVDPAAVRERAADTEALVRHLERLPSINWRLVERGQELFADRCEICHGPFGRPSGIRPPGVAMPADLSAEAFQQRIRDDDIARTIRGGHAVMPGLVPRIDLADVPALVAFVRLLSPGFERYSRYCAACHGDDGRGAGVRFGDDGPHAPTVVFDAEYFARHEPERVRASAWHMLDEQRPAMPHLGRTLTAADARAIIAYLKRAEAALAPD